MILDALLPFHLELKGVAGEKQPVLNYTVSMISVFRLAGRVTL